MSSWSWETIEREALGRWVVAPGPEAPVPFGASFDTRDLKPGQIFVAFEGERTDGHRFLTEAQRRGAAMMLVTNANAVDPSVTVPTMVVRDAVESLTALAACWRRMIRARVVAVTGSNGKTTTTRLVSSVCARAGSVHSPRKSFNNALGVPVTVLGCALDDDYLVCELGTSSEGEIGARASLVKPEVSVITSIGRAHLEELGSLGGVAREKAQILVHTTGVGIVPADSDELTRELTLDPPACRLVRVGVERVTITNSEPMRTAFGLDGEPFVVGAPGAHNAHNAACAVEVARALGIPDETTREGLEHAALPEMRLDRVEIPSATEPIVLYNDAYNANPDSTRAAIAYFRSVDAPMKVTVLGDMLELGAHSEHEHSALVEELSGSGPGSDPTLGQVVLVGPAYARACEGSCAEFHVRDDWSDPTITEITRAIAPGSTVLLKGSRGVALERIIYILASAHAPGAARAGIAAT